GRRWTPSSGRGSTFWRGARAPGRARAWRPPPPCCGRHGDGSGRGGLPALPRGDQGERDELLPRYAPPARAETDGDVRDLHIRPTYRRHRGRVAFDRGKAHRARTRT